MFWSRMHTEITEAVRGCESYQLTQPQQQRQPLMTQLIPVHPWQCVASDCFELNSKHFVLLVDIYSDFVEVSQLPNLSGNSFIKVLKPIFAAHGTPEAIITDNATNYTSSDFCRFLKSWDIEHITSSPHYHQSNGQAEAAVKLMKGIIKNQQRKAQTCRKPYWNGVIQPHLVCTAHQHKDSFPGAITPYYLEKPPITHHKCKQRYKARS